MHIAYRKRYKFACMLWNVFFDWQKLQVIQGYNVGCLFVTECACFVYYDIIMYFLGGCFRSRCYHHPTEIQSRLRFKLFFADDDDDDASLYSSYVSIILQFGFAQNLAVASLTSLQLGQNLSFHLLLISAACCLYDSVVVWSDRHLAALTRPLHFHRHEGECTFVSC